MSLNFPTYAYITKSPVRYSDAAVFSAAAPDYHHPELFPVLLLFHTLQRFNHINLLQLLVHKQIDDHGKSHRQQSAVQEADRFDVSSKHYRIHFHSQNNISVQENSKHRTCQYPDKGKNNILSVHIGRYFLIVESQNLQSRQFSLSFCNINIIKII